MVAKGFICATALTLMTVSGSAIATEGISCKTDFSNGYVYISGFTSPAAEVSVIVPKQGSSLEDEDFGIGDAFYAEQICADNSGKFEFKMRVNENESRVYNVYVTDHLGNQASDKINIISADSPDSDKAEYDLNYVDVSYNGTDEEIPLMQSVEGKMGSAVIWSSDSPLLKISGEKAIIDRTSYEEKTVKLKAHTVYGTASSEEKEFEITINPYTKEDREAIIKAFGASLKDEDADLPQSLAGCNLSWTVSEGEYAKIENGKLMFNRNISEATASVTLTCVIDMNGTLQNEDFVISIDPYKQEEKEQMDIDAISISYNGISSEFEIPSIGSKFGSAFAWASSSPSIIEMFKGKAVVTHPQTDTVVTITVQTDGGVKKSFDITVKGIGSGTSGGGSGSSGGGSGSSGGGSHYSSGGSSGSVKSGVSLSMPSIKTNIEEYREYAYDDMENYEWAKDAVSILTEMGIVNGTAEKKFSPEKNVTRAEFAKMTALTFNYKGENVEMAFEDVEKGAWYEPYIAAMANNGVINGVSETLFGTHENISREDAAVIIYRCMKYTASEPDFYDTGEISDYARDAVGALAKEGIITGFENRFSPKNGLSRAEAAVIIKRCIDAGVKRVIEESDDRSI